MAILLTGATGFIGRHLLAALLERGESIVTLVRCRSRAQGVARIRGALLAIGAKVPPDFDRRVQVCPGDLSAGGLGLSRESREHVLRCCDSVLHCAADVRFDLSLEEARAVNVNGTRELLMLARERRELGPLLRFDAISTAYVAGRDTGLVPETRPSGRSGHRNSYEQSKCEAELLLWNAMGDLPICIFRPSIVLGEAVTGATTSFSTLYVPLRIYARGWWRILPADPECTMDFVPVDFARDAVLWIRSQPASVGQCFHVAAGPEREAKLRELAALAQRMVPGARAVRFQDPERFRRYVLPALRALRGSRFRAIVEAAEAYLAYASRNPSAAPRSSCRTR
jgi:long-chain acyl-CoA synthetase